MREFKGTTGNWFACCTEEGGKSHYVFSDERTICAMRSNDPSESDFEIMEGVVTMSERQANAKLIAAAPDLLEALQMASGIINTNRLLSWDEMDEANEIIDSAIKKATEL